jgi:hypothetical protein
MLFLPSSNHMAQLKTSSPGLPARQNAVRHLMKLIRAALAYLGIVATFSAVTVIGCMIWLLIL